MKPSFVIGFADVDPRDQETVGKEATKIAQLIQAGFPLPPGFIITPEAYFHFLKAPKLDHKIKQLLTTVNFELPESIMQVSNHIKRMVYDAPFSQEFVDQTKRSFARLGSLPIKLQGFSNTFDSPKHTLQLAQDYEEFSTKIKKAWADHFAANLLSHRQIHGIDPLQTGTTLIIQTHLTPEKAGTLVTMDPHHAKNKLIITQIFASGKDTYELSKKTLSILHRHLSHHPHKTPKLTYDEILEIANVGRALEKHVYFPQKIDWVVAKDMLFITNLSQFSELPKPLEQTKHRHAITRGHAITSTIGSGTVNIILTDKDLQKLKSHDILIVEQLKPIHIPYFKKIRGIITEKSKKHSEIAAILRGLGVPTIYDVKNATKRFINGHLITIHGGRGEIYKGMLQ